MKYERIRNLREDFDMTQNDVATILEVKRSTYAMWELGDINFPILKLDLFAQHFKTNIDYLLNLTNNKSKMPAHESLKLEFLGKRLKEFRKEKKLTQKEMAKVIGTNQSAYAYYEYGYTQIPLDKLCKLAKHYNLSINWLCCDSAKKHIQ